MIDNLQFESMKEEFKNLLLNTNRQNIDIVLDWLENKTDFFTAPSSTNYHCNYEHGLLEHSLNVFHLADKIYTNILELKANKLQNISRDNIIISALLHDICKVNFYEQTTKWKKDENNQWITYNGYNIVDKFPFGHGEKSVIFLQMLGLHLNIDEMLAIRWHMGSWDGGLFTNETKFAYNSAINDYPLVTIIQIADNCASLILEETKKN